MIIAEKMESLRRCITRINDKTPDSSQVLENDIDLQDIIVLNLTRAIQVCVDIASHIVSKSNEPAPKTMADSFDTLHKIKAISEQTKNDLISAVGFRNVAVHTYDDINWKIVYSICTQKLDCFRNYSKEISHYAQL